MRRVGFAVGVAALVAGIAVGPADAQTIAAPAVLAQAAATTVVTAEPAAPEPAAPSYHDYFDALGYSFTRGLFNADQAVPLAIGSASAIALWPVDRKVSRALDGRAARLGQAGHIIGSPLVMSALGGGMMIGSLATDNARFRTYAFALSQGLIVAGSLATATKLSVRRTRPNGESRRSFPSGHAAATFALATVSSHYYGKKAGIPLYALASAVALSRVTSGRHYPSDVVAGATIGYLAGRAAVLAAQHVSVGTSASGGGGVRVYFAF